MHFITYEDGEGQGMHCCGVSYIMGFPFDPYYQQDDRVAGRFREDLRDVKERARADNQALLLATTVQGQERSAAILTAAGFEADDTARRAQNGNAITLWSYPVGGYI